MRDAIIYQKSPANPQLSDINELHRRFKSEFDELNNE